MGFQVGGGRTVTSDTNVMNWVKFRRICMESSECNWVYISKTICPGMLNLASRPFRCCSFIIPRKIHFDFFFNGVTLSISRGFGPCDSLAQYYTADWNKALMLQSSQEIHNLNFKKSSGCICSFNQIIKQDYLKYVLQIILPVSYTVIRHFQFTGSGDTPSRLPLLYSSHNCQGPTTQAIIEVKS